MQIVHYNVVGSWGFIFMEGSEYALLKRRIEAEYAATYSGLHGLSALSTKHEVITARMERLATVTQELAKEHGSHVVFPIMIELDNDYRQLEDLS